MMKYKPVHMFALLRRCVRKMMCFRFNFGRHTDLVSYWQNNRKPAFHKKPCYRYRVSLVHRRARTEGNLRSPTIKRTGEFSFPFREFILCIPPGSQAYIPLSVFSETAQQTVTFRDGSITRQKRSRP